MLFPKPLKPMRPLINFLRRVKHYTCGSTDGLKKFKFFNSVDEFMNWYNFIRPHGAFDIEKLETPAVIFYQRLPKKEVIMDPPLLENIGGVK